LEGAAVVAHVAVMVPVAVQVFFFINQVVVLV
jgi:hypothetical protein